MKLQPHQQHLEQPITLTQRHQLPSQQQAEPWLFAGKVAADDRDSSRTGFVRPEREQGAVVARRPAANGAQVQGRSPVVLNQQQQEGKEENFILWFDVSCTYLNGSGIQHLTWHL